MFPAESQPESVQGDVGPSDPETPNNRHLNCPSGVGVGRTRALNRSCHPGDETQPPVVDEPALLAAQGFTSVIDSASQLTVPGNGNPRPHPPEESGPVGRGPPGRQWGGSLEPLHRSHSNPAHEQTPPLSQARKNLRICGVGNPSAQPHAQAESTTSTLFCAHLGHERGPDSITDRSRPTRLPDRASSAAQRYWKAASNKRSVGRRCIAHDELHRREGLTGTRNHVRVDIDANDVVRDRPESQMHPVPHPMPITDAGVRPSTTRPAPAVGDKVVTVVRGGVPAHYRNRPDRCTEPAHPRPTGRTYRPCVVLRTAHGVE